MLLAVSVGWVFTSGLSSTITGATTIVTILRFCSDVLGGEDLGHTEGGNDDGDHSLDNFHGSWLREAWSNVDKLENEDFLAAYVSCPAIKLQYMYYTCCGAW